MKDACAATTRQTAARFPAHHYFPIMFGAGRSLALIIAQLSREGRSLTRRCRGAPAPPPRARSTSASRPRAILPKSPAATVPPNVTTSTVFSFNHRWRSTCALEHRAASAPQCRTQLQDILAQRQKELSHLIAPPPSPLAEGVLRAETTVQPRPAQM